MTQHNYISPELTKAWIIKAYGLHILILTMILAELVVLLVGVFTLVINPVFGVVIICTSFIKVICYVYAYMTAYVHRTTEYLDLKDNLNPELIQAIITLVTNPELAKKIKK